MAEHTETPWRVEELQSGEVGIFAGAELVATAYIFPTYLQQKANAEFIVLACNSHDAILEALEEVITLLERWTQPGNKVLDGAIPGPARDVARAKVAWPTPTWPGGSPQGHRAPFVARRILAALYMQSALAEKRQWPTGKGRNHA